jgi:hypothetical protein
MTTTPDLAIWPTEFWGFFDFGMGVSMGAYSRLNDHFTLDCSTAMF